VEARTDRPIGMGEHRLAHRIVDVVDILILSQAVVAMEDFNVVPSRKSEIENARPETIMLGIDIEQEVSGIRILGLRFSCPSDGSRFFTFSVFKNTKSSNKADIDVVGQLIYLVEEFDLPLVISIGVVRVPDNHIWTGEVSM